MTLGWGGSEADEALQIDVYLESLLTARAGAPQAAPDAALEAGLDAGQRRAAHLLASQLLRFHPSYRFEEALATRLRLAALRHLAPDAGWSAAPLGEGEFGSKPPGAGVLIAFPSASTAVEPDAREGWSAADRRRVLIGGAIASGVSLAGAAIVAWRAATPPRTPFGRATRAAHRARPPVRGRA